MKKINLSIILVMAIFISTTVAAQAGDANITVKQTAEKITISGNKCKKATSDKFALSKDAWYIIKIAYTGKDVSICQLSLVNQKMIDEKMTVGGMLTNWMGPNTTEIVRSKGSAKSEDYMIYVDDVGGPWTIEILKSPKPVTVSKETTFKGTKNTVTSFFHMNKGPASFTINQKLKSQWGSRINVSLYNADTGEFVANLCHNDDSPTQTANKEIPSAGAYVFEIVGGDSWQVSFKQ